MGLGGTGNVSCLCGVGLCVKGGGGCKATPCVEKAGVLGNWEEGGGLNARAAAGRDACCDGGVDCPLFRPAGWAIIAAAVVQVLAHKLPGLSMLSTLGFIAVLCTAAGIGLAAGLLADALANDCSHFERVSVSAA